MPACEDLCDNPIIHLWQKHQEVGISMQASDHDCTGVRDTAAGTFHSWDDKMVSPVSSNILLYLDKMPAKSEPVFLNENKSK